MEKKTFVLGENSPIELELLEKGDLRQINNSFYELKNKFFSHGRGDLAMRGEKITIREDGKPYR